MPRPKSDPKTDALRMHSCLHPHPEKVTDEAFAASEFFDPRDLELPRFRGRFWTLGSNLWFLINRGSIAEVGPVWKKTASLEAPGSTISR